MHAKEIMKIFEEKTNTFFNECDHEVEDVGNQLNEMIERIKFSYKVS